MSNKQPPLSVIMTVYNGSRRLKDTLISLQEQTFQDFELIIVDDSSTDDSWDIIQQIDRAWVRAHRHTERKGQTHALLAGIALAGGEFIARHDAEDLSDPDRFSKQIAYLRKHNKVAVVGTQSEWIDGAGKCVHQFEYPTTHKAISKQLKENNCFSHGSVMMRRDALLEVGSYRASFKLAQDYDLWLRLLEKYQGANLNETLYQERFTLRMTRLSNDDEQAAYEQLARQLAAARSEREEEQTNLEEAAEHLAKTFRRGFFMSRINQARNFVRWAERMQSWGEPASTYTWSIWNYALLAWPFSWPVWKFFWQEIGKRFKSSKDKADVDA